MAEEGPHAGASAPEADASDEAAAESSVIGVDTCNGESGRATSPPASPVRASSSSSPPGSPSRSTLLYLRGLPWGSGTEEIRSFFEPLSVEEVTLVNGVAGKPTGEAFVRLSTLEATAAALKYNMQMIGKRYIEIWQSSEEDMKNRIKHSGVRDVSSGLVRCRGLPFTCTAADVVELFSSFDISEEQVTIGIHASGPFAGSPNGEALVMLGDHDTAKRALAELHMMTIGQRYIELFLTAEAERINFQIPSLHERDGESLSSMAAACLLRARGLPFLSTVEEVAQFFAGYSVEPQNVMLLIGADGRPRGEALVWLPSAETAAAARKALHGQLLGRRYVELFPPGPTEVARAVAAVAGFVPVLAGPNGLQGKGARRRGRSRSKQDQGQTHMAVWAYGNVYGGGVYPGAIPPSHTGDGVSGYYAVPEAAVGVYHASGMMPYIPSSATAYGYFAYDVNSSQRPS